MLDGRSHDGRNVDRQTAAMTAASSSRARARHASRITSAVDSGAEVCSWVAAQDPLHSVPSRHTAAKQPISTKPKLPSTPTFPLQIPKYYISSRCGGIPLKPQPSAGAVPVCAGRSSGAGRARDAICLRSVASGRYSVGARVVKIR
eukprot:1829331-Prymnesium_polylepis.1